MLIGLGPRSVVGPGLDPGERGVVQADYLGLGAVEHVVPGTEAPGVVVVRDELVERSPELGQGLEVQRVARVVGVVGDRVVAPLSGLRRARRDGGGSFAPHMVVAAVRAGACWVHPRRMRSGPRRSSSLSVSIDLVAISSPGSTVSAAARRTWPRAP